MNFNVVFRVNPATYSSEPYFRLMESFRNEFGEPRNRTILTVGFDMQDILPEQVKLVAEGLTRLHQSSGCRQCLFGDVLDGYNTEGFIRYSSILAGNTADPASLPDMIDTICQQTRTPTAPRPQNPGMPLCRNCHRRQPAPHQRQRIQLPMRQPQSPHRLRTRRRRQNRQSHRC